MIETLVALKEKALADFQNKKFARSAESFRKCITLLEDSGEDLELAEIRNDLSVVLLQLKDANAALETVLNTDKVFAHFGKQKQQAMALANTAAALEKLKRRDEALSCYEQSSAILNELEEKDLRATILRQISDLQLKTGKHFQAMATLEAAYEQKPDSGIKNRVIKDILASIRKKFY